VNLPSRRNPFRPLTGLVLAASLLGIPATSAAAATAPLENRYCDSESGYDCLSYGYAPDYQSNYQPDHDHDRNHRY
jgi:hypothetical protein